MTRKNPTQMPLPWQRHRTLPNGFRRNVAAGGAGEGGGGCTENPPGPRRHHCDSSKSPAGFGPSHAGRSPVPAALPFGGCQGVPCLGGGTQGGLSPSATRVGGAEACHRENGGTGGWYTRKKAAERYRQGKVCPAGRAPGTVLRDVGWVPRRARRRVLGPPSPAHAAPSTAACPGPSHSLGPSLLPRGSLGATERGPQHNKMAQTGCHGGCNGGRRGKSLDPALDPWVPWCPGECDLHALCQGHHSGGVPAPPVMAVPQAAGWLGGCPLRPVRVPVVAITPGPWHPGTGWAAPQHPGQQGWSVPWCYDHTEQHGSAFALLAVPWEALAASEAEFLEQIKEKTHTGRVQPCPAPERGYF